MKLGIDAVGVDHNGNEFARRNLDRSRRHFDQRVADHLKHLMHMAVYDSRDQRLLTREVLVERADANPRYGGDLISARPVVAFLHQNASSRIEKHIDGQT